MSETPYTAVQIELGGRKRTLRCTLRAMRLVQKETGADLFRGARPGPEHLGVLLWALLAHEDRELTVEQAEELIDLGNIQMVAARIAEALATDQPAAGELMGEAQADGPLAPAETPATETGPATT